MQEEKNPRNGDERTGEENLRKRERGDQSYTTCKNKGTEGGKVTAEGKERERKVRRRG